MVIALRQQKTTKKEKCFILNLTKKRFLRKKEKLCVFLKCKGGGLVHFRAWNFIVTWCFTQCVGFEGGSEPFDPVQSVTRFESGRYRNHGCSWFLKLHGGECREATIGSLPEQVSAVLNEDLWLPSNRTKKKLSGNVEQQIAPCRRVFARDSVAFLRLPCDRESRSVCEVASQFRWFVN